MIGEWYTKAKTGVKKNTLRPMGSANSLPAVALWLFALSLGAEPCGALAAPAAAALGSTTDIRFTTRVRGGYGQTLQIHQLEVELGILSRKPIRLGPHTQLSVDSIAPDGSSVFLLVADPRLVDADQVVGMDTASAHPLIAVFGLVQTGRRRPSGSASAASRADPGTLELVIEVLMPDSAARPERSLDYERWKKWDPLRNWFEKRKENKKSIIRADAHRPIRSST